MIPVFYNPEQSTKTRSFSPSPSKPVKVIADWAERKLNIERRESGFVELHELELAHDREFVLDILHCRRENGFGNTDPAVAHSLPFSVGSMVSAARHVARLRQRDEVTAACSPSSGFHHAGYDFCGGYCTFNGLIVAAVSVIRSNLAHTVGIIDCDYHWGDGTDSIIEHLGWQKQIPHFTAGESYLDKANAEALLSTLPAVIEGMAKRGTTVVLYQAGADQHIDDPLGGLLTTEQMRKRDAIVFEACKANGIAVAWNLAGGYQMDKQGRIDKVLTLHRNTMKECIRVFG